MSLEKQEYCDIWYAKCVQLYTSFTYISSFRDSCMMFLNFLEIKKEKYCNFILICCEILCNTLFSHSLFRHRSMYWMIWMSSTCNKLRWAFDFIFTVKRSFFSIIYNILHIFFLKWFIKFYQIIIWHKIPIKPSAHFSPVGKKSEIVIHIRKYNIKCFANFAKHVRIFARELCVFSVFWGRISNGAMKQCWKWWNETMCIHFR